MIPSTEIHASNNAKIIFSALNVVGQHYYYRNSAINEIFFLNIPKSASSYIRNAMHFIDNPDTEPKSFCIVRNPLERFLSIYKYMVNVEEKFDAFFQAFLYKKDLSKENYIKVGVEHIMPQSFFTKNAPANWKKNCQLITMDDFFVDGVNAGLKKVGLKSRVDLPNTKANPSDYGLSYKNWLTNKIYNEHSDIFDEYLAQDFELYEQAKRGLTLSE